MLTRTGREVHFTASVLSSDAPQTSRNILCSGPALAAQRHTKNHTGCNETCSHSILWTYQKFL